MLLKIVFGVIIGIVAGFFTCKNERYSDTERVANILAVIVVPLLFIIFSFFSYGIGYGIMAIIEIVVGLAIGVRIFDE